MAGKIDVGKNPIYRHVKGGDEEIYQILFYEYSKFQWM